MEILGPYCRSIFALSSLQRIPFYTPFFLPLARRYE